MLPLGTWWMQAAVDGAVAQLPIVNVPADADASDAANAIRALCAAY